MGRFANDFPPARPGFPWDGMTSIPEGLPAPYKSAKHEHSLLVAAIKERPDIWLWVNCQAEIQETREEIFHGHRHI
jgi:hypothetical protein